jgi:hypothetical protein
MLKSVWTPRELKELLDGCDDKLLPDTFPTDNEDILDTFEDPDDNCRCICNDEACNGNVVPDDGAFTPEVTDGGEENVVEWIEAYPECCCA